MEFNHQPLEILKSIVSILKLKTKLPAIFEYI